jgi:hypothetical protein
MAQMKKLVLIVLATLFAVTLLQGAAADGITLKAPKNLTESIADTCNETCVSSCNTTWNAYAKWWKDDISSDDSKRCDVCASAYYAQDFNVDVGKCPCKTLEQFRKLTKDKTMVPDDQCVDCCLMWAMDTLVYEADCKEPQVMVAKDKQDDERNSCGFTIKKLTDNPNYDGAKGSSDSKDSNSSSDSSSDSEDSGSKSGGSKKKDGTPTSYTYDYSSLGSQFDTCKCICKGLAPCKAPKDAPTDGSSGASSQTASSFFNSAAFSSSAGDSSALSAILP